MRDLENTALIIDKYMRGKVAKEELVGVWKIVSVKCRYGPAGKEERPFGDNPTGFLSYTPGGRMSVILASSGQAIGIFFGYAGTYTFTGDKVIHHVEASIDPEWIGKDLSRSVSFEGGNLILKGGLPADPESREHVLRWERIE